MMSYFITNSILIFGASNIFKKSWNFDMIFFFAFEIFYKNENLWNFCFDYFWLFVNNSLFVKNAS